MKKSEIEDAKIRVQKLRTLIDELRYKYHVLDDPTATDAQYDSLMRELVALESAFPSLRDPNSPSQKIGGEPLKKFERYKHRFPMLSLNDAFDEKEIQEWYERLSRAANEAEMKAAGYYCEIKMDGLAVSLIYENGELRRGLTRGDGLVGEDVTANIRTIRSIPLVLRRKSKYYQVVQERVEIRGEIFMSLESFESLNKERTRKGEALFANPRNAAAGSIRQLDSKITSSRNLDFMAYAVLGPETRYHHEEHEIAKDLGLPTNKFNQEAKNLNEVIKLWYKWEKIRPRLPYQIDGMVVNIDNKILFDKLGVVGKAPRGAIAFKWPAEEGTTVVTDIEVRVGRTGVLTPTAHLKPVLVAGSTVTRATLHNEDEILKKDVRIGDTVIVRKAGDIIPEVVRVIKELRTGRERKFLMPTTCPICGGKVERKESEVGHYCLNKDCFAIEKEKIIHFVSRGAFDIEGLGEKIVEQLLLGGLIADAADIFSLTEGDLLPLERFAETSAQKLISAINIKKKVSFARLVYSLGIRHIGEVTAYDISRNFQSLDELMNASAESLLEIEGIGEVAAGSIRDWFQDERNGQFLKKMRSSGMEIIYERTGQALEGKAFVVTGTLPSLSREEAEDLVRKNGGKVQSSVSKETNFLVLGKNPGSKYQKARDLNVTVISEQDFLKMVK